MGVFDDLMKDLDPAGGATKFLKRDYQSAAELAKSAEEMAKKGITALDRGKGIRRFTVDTSALLLELRNAADEMEQAFENLHDITSNTIINGCTNLANDIAAIRSPLRFEMSVEIQAFATLARAMVSELGAMYRETSISYTNYSIRMTTALQSAQRYGGLKGSSDPNIIRIRNIAQSFLNLQVQAGMTEFEQVFNAYAANLRNTPIYLASNPLSTTGAGNNEVVGRGYFEIMTYLSYAFIELGKLYDLYSKFTSNPNFATTDPRVRTAIATLHDTLLQQIAVTLPHNQLNGVTILAIAEITPMMATIAALPNLDVAVDAADFVTNTMTQFTEIGNATLTGIVAAARPAAEGVRNNSVARVPVAVTPAPKSKVEQLLERFFDP